MKQLITKEQVAKAISELTAAGKKATLQAIRAALGDVGSITTILRLKSELDDESCETSVSASSLASFKEIWAQAVDEGRAQRVEEMTELRQAIDAMTSELEQAEGAASGARSKLADVEAQRDGLIAQVAEANAAATAARATGEQSAVKLADALQRLNEQQTAHAKETAALRKLAHDSEIALARLEGEKAAAVLRKRAPKPPAK